ncbi:unannotated protein [freshwater metagenome]|uniref:Unannotated protein n=1 Tax=freshwater metagenome TaxID=449393 RepID=A0A6J7H1W4_9ZZZZ
MPGWEVDEEQKRLNPMLWLAVPNESFAAAPAGAPGLDAYAPAV